MKVKEAHMQAFPFIEPEKDDNIKSYHPGMTMRDYFAAKAMQGMLSDLPETLWGIDWQVNVANSSYSVADAMMKARK